MAMQAHSSEQRVERDSSPAAEGPSWFSSPTKNHQVEITLKGVRFDEDLLHSIQRTCQVVGGSVSDETEWEVVLELMAPTNRVRATIHMHTPQGFMWSSTVGSAPYEAVQYGLLSLLERIPCSGCIDVGGEIEVDASSDAPDYLEEAS